MFYQMLAVFCVLVSKTQGFGLFEGLGHILNDATSLVSNTVKTAVNGGLAVAKGIQGTVNDGLSEVLQGHILGAGQAMAHGVTNTLVSGVKTVAEGAKTNLDIANDMTKTASGGFLDAKPLVQGADKVVDMAVGGTKMVAEGANDIVDAASGFAHYLGTGVVSGVEHAIFKPEISHGMVNDAERIFDESNSYFENLFDTFKDTGVGCDILLRGMYNANRQLNCIFHRDPDIVIHSKNCTTESEEDMINKCQPEDEFFDQLSSEIKCLKTQLQILRERSHQLQTFHLLSLSDHLKACGYIPKP